ncbi:histidine kinase [uncultured Planktosalinus sp.]|uniref:PAS domain S-box protein n=1 Tax=uncultured Planktosalinus sp. TaxID=1810935 RepID=UPI0030DD94CB
MKLQHNKEIKILVVEDNMGDYILISEYLNECFEEPLIEQVKTFNEAKNILNDDTAKFDVILLDLSLPDDQGESLISKTLSLCQNIPVIILTGNTDLDFALKALNLGVTDYLIKSEISPVALFKSILFSIERKEIGHQLNKSKKEYQDLFNLSPLPIFIYDVNTLMFLDVNKATEEHYGFSKQEFLNITLYDIRPKKEVETLSKAIESLKNEHKKYTTRTALHKKKNGELMLVQIHGFAIEYQNKLAETIIINDITKQKKYEDEIVAVNTKLRHLTAHLQKVREEERITISREIHDELGQQLTGIKLDVSWLKNKLETIYPEANERTARLIKGINKTINDVRKISTNLRPGVLDDLGLEAAIEWKSNQFEEQTGIKCILDIEEDILDYGTEINTAIYRIYQEALTNIARHSNASEVLINLKTKDKKLYFEVIDNGKGISEADKNNNISLGLTGMKERAIILNGDFFIENLNGNGTKLKVLVPLDN